MACNKNLPGCSSGLLDLLGRRALTSPQKPETAANSAMGSRRGKGLEKGSGSADDPKSTLYQHYTDLTQEPQKRPHDIPGESWKPIFEASDLPARAPGLFRLKPIRCFEVRSCQARSQERKTQEN